MRIGRIGSGDWRRVSVPWWNIMGRLGDRPGRMRCPVVVLLLPRRAADIIWHRPGSRKLGGMDWENHRRGDQHRTSPRLTLLAGCRFPLGRVSSFTCRICRVSGLRSGMTLLGASSLALLRTHDQG